ncbi:MULTISPECIES: DUF6338 family protein [Rhodococcus]|uniref:DUF6338 family protein n=1 Tax=Rhodococcus TaxID=1827 RepID=UPI0004C32827|nr:MULTISPECIES: DUF6338 family protein [Rhodococcus]ANQ76022.1 hypothetical protein AOT96_33800 [Rhodococcus sp. 008]MCJ0901259.1 DUF6338 family protein [Rhodococcus sp. ARC_M13]
MTISTWFAVLAFFLFVAPGLLYDLASAKKRIKQPETVFTEISRIAFVSAMCSLAALGLLALVSWIAGRCGARPLPDLPALIRGGSIYIADHLGEVAFAAALGLAVSLGISYVGYRIVHRGDSSGILYISAWHSVLRDDRPTPTTPVHVMVKLKNGSTWAGRVAKYSPDLELANRELVLEPPLAVRKDSTVGLVPIDVKWKRVILSGPEIVSIATSYGDGSSPPSTPTPPQPPPTPPTSPPTPP